MKQARQTRKNEKEYIPKIQFSIGINEKITVESCREGYRKISFSLPKLEVRDLQERFYWVVLGRPEEIKNKTHPWKIENESKICKEFCNFLSRAIHTPHIGKKLWEKDGAWIIRKLDPIRHYSLIWNTLDNIFQGI